MEKAIWKELQTLEKKKTWSPVMDKSQVRNTLYSHIGLKIKRNEAGQPKKFKACVVADGHKQVFEETMKKYMHLWSALSCAC